MLDRSIDRKDQQNLIDVMKDIVSDRKNKLSEHGIYEIKNKAYSDLKVKRALDFTNLEREKSIEVVEEVESVTSSQKLPTLISQKNSCMATVKKLQVICNQERKGFLNSKNSLNILNSPLNLNSPRASLKSTDSQKGKYQQGGLVKVSSKIEFNTKNIQILSEKNMNFLVQSPNSIKQNLNESLPILEGQRGLRSEDKTGTSINSKRSSQVLLPTQIDEAKVPSHLFSRPKSKQAGDVADGAAGPASQKPSRPPSGIKFIRNPHFYQPPSFKSNTKMFYPYPKMASRLPRRLKVTHSAFNDFYTPKRLPANYFFRCIGKTVLAAVRWRRCCLLSEAACLDRWRVFAQEIDREAERDEASQTANFQLLGDVMQERADRNERIRKKRGDLDASNLDTVRDSVEEATLEDPLPEPEKQPGPKQVSSMKKNQTETKFKFKNDDTLVRKITFIENSVKPEVTKRDGTSIAEIVEVSLLPEPRNKPKSTKLLDSYRRLPTSNSIKKPMSLIEFEHSFLEDSREENKYEQDFLFHRPGLRTIDLLNEYPLHNVDIKARQAMAKISPDSDEPYTSYWMEKIRGLLFEPSLNDMDANSAGYYSFLGLNDVGEVRVDGEEHLDVHKIKSRRAFITFFSKVILDLGVDEQVLPGCHDDDYHEASVSVPDDREPGYYVQPEEFNRRFYINLYAPHFEAERKARESLRSTTRLK